LSKIITKKLKKLGFKKIPGTEPGFHMWELDSKNLKIESSQARKRTSSQADKLASGQARKR
jgi:hypothetical protein